MQSSTKAGWAVFLSLVGLCFFPLALIGLVLGIVALREFGSGYYDGKNTAITAVVIGAIISTIAVIVFLSTAIPAYTTNFDFQRALLCGLAAALAGAAAGALLSLAAGKYRNKSQIGPLPLGAYWQSSERLGKRFLPSGMPAEEPLIAEVVESPPNFPRV